jgi:hypothetical protein
MATDASVRLQPRPFAIQALGRAVGWMAIIFSLLYFISDVVEVLQGGFSRPQLSLTLVAEAAVPLFVVGLYLLQRPQIGPLGLTTAALYSYSFVFFTGTVLFALMTSTPDWDALVDRLGLWMTLHGVVMIIGGLGFGLAILRAGVLPRWTGLTLMVGVGLVAVTSGSGDLAQIGAAGIRDFAFIGMGASLLLAARRYNAPRLHHSTGREAPTARRSS